MTASILLIDDDDDLRSLIADVLRSRGDEVRECRNGSDGLHALDERFPQLVVCDIDMPVLDGPGMVYRMFIDNLGRENIPVILISASVHLAQIAANLGTPYYLGKPFFSRALLAIIDRALAEALPPRPPTPFLVT
jgi:CheY-like chemotaxis protein